MGEQWKGKVAHHKKGNKKRKYYWLRSVCKTREKAQHCVRTHAPTQHSSLTPHSSHQSPVRPFQRQRDAIKTSSDIMSIARSFAGMKDILWADSMWYGNTNLAGISSSFSPFIMIIAKDVLLLKVRDYLHLIDAPRQMVFHSLLLGLALLSSLGTHLVN